MPLFETLAEARIQDWIRRGRPHNPALAGLLDGPSLEAQLLAEIGALRSAARLQTELQSGSETESETRQALLTASRKRELQLMVLLESSGRSLAARAIAERIAGM